PRSRAGGRGGVPGGAPDPLADGLTRLQSAEFLYETSLVPDTVYTFKHALTHEVAYDSLLHERRRALHARLRGPRTALAEYRRLLDHLRRAQALAETLGDQQRLVRVSSYVSQCLRWVGD